ncbi:MAG: hypothetical protein EBZ77_11395, partial [Chitinophagia bacterium]|nr:hypothetical protein [Chitinophagia bacterium]
MVLGAVATVEYTGAGGGTNKIDATFTVSSGGKRRDVSVAVRCGAGPTRAAYVGPQYGLAPAQVDAVMLYALEGAAATATAAEQKVALDRALDEAEDTGLVVDAARAVRVVVGARTMGRSARDLFAEFGVAVGVNETEGAYAARVKAYARLGSFLAAMEQRAFPVARAYLGSSEYTATVDLDGFSVTGTRDLVSANHGVVDRDESAETAVHRTLVRVTAGDAVKVDGLSLVGASPTVTTTTANGTRVTVTARPAPTLVFATGNARDPRRRPRDPRVTDLERVLRRRLARFELEGHVTAGVRRGYAVLARAIDGTLQTIEELGECRYYEDDAAGGAVVVQSNGVVTLEPGQAAAKYTLEIRNARVAGSAARMTTSFVRGEVFRAPTTALVGAVPRAVQDQGLVYATERNARVAAGAPHDVAVWFDAPCFGAVTFAIAALARAVAVRVAFTGAKVSAQDAAISVMCAGASYGKSADAALAVCGATNASALELEMSRPSGVTAVRAVEHDTGAAYGTVGAFEVVGSRVVVARYTLGSSVARGGVRFEATLEGSDTIQFSPVAVRARVQVPQGRYTAVTGAAAELAVPFDAESAYCADAASLAVAGRTVRVVFPSTTTTKSVVVAAKDTRERVDVAVDAATWPRVTTVVRDAARVALTLSAPPPVGSTVSVESATSTVGAATLAGSTISVGMVPTAVSATVSVASSTYQEDAAIDTLAVGGLYGTALGSIASVELVLSAEA